MPWRRPVCLVVSTSLLALSTPRAVRSEIGGAAGRPITYTGEVDRGADETCRLSIGLERVAFVLTSLANRYRFVRVLIECRGRTPLVLSSTDDRLDLVLEERTVPGVLSLQRADAELWDGLDATMRQTLAYPPSVRPGEPVYVFAYFPKPGVDDLPRSFSYTIASLGVTVRLEHRVAAARG